jgi:hypothetical protein
LNKYIRTILQLLRGLYFLFSNRNWTKYLNFFRDGFDSWCHRGHSISLNHHQLCYINFFIGPLFMLIVLRVISTTPKFMPQLMLMEKYDILDRKPCISNKCSLLMSGIQFVHYCALGKHVELVLAYPTHLLVTHTNESIHNTNV